MKQQLPARGWGRRECRWDDGLCSPPNSDVEVLASNGTVIGDRAFIEIIKVKRGSDLIGLVFLS